MKFQNWQNDIIGKLCRNSFPFFCALNFAKTNDTMDILLLFTGAMGLPSFINVNLHCYCVFLHLEAIIILVTDEATCEEQQFLECSFLHLGEWASHCFSGLPQSSSSSSSLNASSLWLLPLKTKGKATLLKQILMLIWILLIMVFADSFLHGQISWDFYCSFHGTEVTNFIGTWKLNSANPTQYWKFKLKKLNMTSTSNFYFGCLHVKVESRSMCEPLSHDKDIGI